MIEYDKPKVDYDCVSCRGLDTYCNQFQPNRDGYCIEFEVLQTELEVILELRDIVNIEKLLGEE